MNFQQACETVESVLGPSSARGACARTWFLSDRFVAKVLVASPGQWQNLRQMSRWSAEVPIARILELRPMGNDVQLGIDVVVGFMVQERLPMRDLGKSVCWPDTSWYGGYGEVPPSGFWVNDNLWYQTDDHSGNYSMGHWLDLGSIRPLVREWNDIAYSFTDEMPPSPRPYDA